MKRTTGWGPFRKDWYSICSLHQKYNENCKLCREGEWVNHWCHALDHILFWLWPDGWRRWHNRRS